MDQDQFVPMSSHFDQLSFREELHFLDNLIIPRHSKCIEPINLQMHGFSYSLALAYKACIYIWCIDPSGNATFRLIGAKSEVATLEKITLLCLQL